MSLKIYNEKRNFCSTNEPEGTVCQNDANRFVVQYHQARAKHYDFRLEYEGVLLSWAIPKGLSQDPKMRRLAVMVEDHPVDYIDFEGVIPKGNYGAGSVEIFDKGIYLPLEDFKKGLKKGHIRFVLNGQKYKGAWALIKIDEKNWLIIKQEDEYTFKEKTKSEKNPFKKCSLQLATLTKKIPTGREWLFEIKYDGYRIVSYVENDNVKMLTRNNKDYTSKFKDIKESLKKMKQTSFVVDGEVVSFDSKGRSDFGLLQKKLKVGQGEIYYVIFDLLALNGEDLRELPLLERKKKLKLLFAKADNKLIFSSFVVGKGKESMTLALENNLEGIIAKKINSKYQGERNEDWLKIKCYSRQEFVVAGYSTSDKNPVLSAVLLGYYNNRDFVYVGKVGTGFSEEQKKSLRKKFAKYETKDCPFCKDLKLKNVVWLKPSLVAEVQFVEFTKEKLLRQPSFIAMREDKKPLEVKLEVESENSNN